VKAGCWFASRPKAGVAFSLVGCTVAPGFDFDDFEMAERDALCPEYPPHQALINDLTR
jgi:predicted cupin superfamily sugar epimerase